jgi:6-phosphogluconolactonase (cycloisomerase 2 family)
MQRSTGTAALALGLVLFSASLAVAAGSPGAVYTITNAPSGNAVVAYDRAGNGTLSPGGVFATGGAGSGASLNSQGAVIVSDDQRFLFAVNAGSNSISSFRVVHDGLELVDIVPSGGLLPTSLTYRTGLLYVLNAGTPNSIAGFNVDRRGRLTPLFGSTRALSAPTTNPGQIGFSDDGSVLIVSERLTNLLDVYQLDDDGMPLFQMALPSAGPTPYGFAVDKRNTLFVSEAGAGGGASSYRITYPAGLDPVSSMVVTGQRAACWAVVTKNGKFGYVINAGTGNISGFAIGHDGSATLLNADGITATTGGNPTDAALSNDSRYLYVRVSALGMIAVFRVESDGSLTRLRSITGTPTTVVGMAAY